MTHNTHSDECKGAVFVNENEIVKGMCVCHAVVVLLFFPKI